MKITAKLLKNLKACEDGLEDFKLLFPRGCQPTPLNLSRWFGTSSNPAGYNDIQWLLRELLGVAREWKVYLTVDKAITYTEGTPYLRYSYVFYEAYIAAASAELMEL